MIRAAIKKYLLAWVVWLVASSVVSYVASLLIPKVVVWVSYGVGFRTPGALSVLILGLLYAVALVASFAFFAVVVDRMIVQRQPLVPMAVESEPSGPLT